MVSVVYKKEPGAANARKNWCKCVDQLSELLDKEVKENPRYNEFDLKSFREP